MLDPLLVGPPLVAVVPAKIIALLLTLTVCSFSDVVAFEVRAFGPMLRPVSGASLRWRLLLRT